MGYMGYEDPGFNQKVRGQSFWRWYKWGYRLSKSFSTEVPEFSMTPPNGIDKFYHI